MAEILYLKLSAWVNDKDNELSFRSNFDASCLQANLLMTSSFKNLSLDGGQVLVISVTAITINATDFPGNIIEFFSVLWETVEWRKLQIYLEAKVTLINKMLSPILITIQCFVSIFYFNCKYILCN